MLQTATVALMFNDGDGQREYWVDGTCIGWIESGREMIDGHGNPKGEWRFTPVNPDFSRGPVRRSFSDARQDLREHLRDLGYTGLVDFTPTTERPRPEPFAVVHAPPTLRAGDRATVLDRFSTERTASEFIEGLAASDPEGVDRGDYGIDGPDEPVPSPSALVFRSTCPRCETVLDEVPVHAGQHPVEGQETWRAAVLWGWLAQQEHNKRGCPADAPAVISNTHAE